jgi:hypothetical protein
MDVVTGTEEAHMDATRTRRTRDAARQRWYATCRCRRFARLLGFKGAVPCNREKK